MFEIEYREVRAGEWQTFVRRFRERTEADDFYDSMRRVGTRPDLIKKGYPEP